MYDNGMKGLMVMIILFVTLSLVLMMHAKDGLLPFFAPYMPSSLHSLLVLTRLFSFSPDCDSVQGM
jgi:hypothetical protein